MTCGVECCGLCCVAWLVMRSVRMELRRGIDSYVCGWCWGIVGVGVRGIAANKIRAEGAAAVAEALKQNSTLTSLDLSGKWVWRGGRGGRRRSGLRVMGVEVARREGRLSGCLLMEVGAG